MVRVELTLEAKLLIVVLALLEGAGADTPQRPARLLCLGLFLLLLLPLVLLVVPLAVVLLDVLVLPNLDWRHVLRDCFEVAFDGHNHVKRVSGDLVPSALLKFFDGVHQAAKLPTSPVELAFVLREESDRHVLGDVAEQRWIHRLHFKQPRALPARQGLAMESYEAHTVSGEHRGKPSFG